MKHKVWELCCVSLLCLGVVLGSFFHSVGTVQTSAEGQTADYIKWMEFEIPYGALAAAMKLDMDTYGSDSHKDWVKLLAALAVKYGGEWSHYKEKDLQAVAEKMDGGETDFGKTYDYYCKAYGAVLDGFLGETQKEVYDEETQGKKLVTTYGLKVYSPIARGYDYSHYNDFGTSRSFGYSRPHLGHDLMGNVGTPIIAMESGYVETLGWNPYGGWRIGIRSFDGKRYYYYAHLRSNHPYTKELYEGKTVTAGDVIGYMGNTGYSTTENKSNITTTHLHMGLEIIFDESQKDGYNQIWVDLYSLTRLLEKNRSAVRKDDATGDYVRVYDQFDVDD